MRVNLCLLACLVGSIFGGETPSPKDPQIAAAHRNGALAQEALVRSRRVLHAYLKRLDPITGLIRTSTRNPNWTVHNAAADLYPFLVMAAYFTDRAAYEDEMLAILRNEVSHTTRVGRLSDHALPGGKGFVREKLDLTASCSAPASTSKMVFSP